MFLTPKRYFLGGATILTIINFIINYFTINWSNKGYIGVFYLLFQNICVFFVSEIPLKSLLILFYRKSKIKFQRELSKSSFIINYNLKASSQIEIDECFGNAINAFLGNLSTESLIVIISVTTMHSLKNYENQAYLKYKKLLFARLYTRANDYLVHKKTDKFWRMQNLNSNNILTVITKLHENFVFLRRNTRTLRKCGQYQDLISLSEGYSKTYTYFNSSLYGPRSRMKGLDLFTYYEELYTEDEELKLKSDISKIHNKKYKYTIVLDIDTIAPPKSIIKLLQVADANPEFDIIQPKIKFYKLETLFQSLQNLTHIYSSIAHDYTTSFLGHAPFYGKALINNKQYFDKLIGTPDKVIEYVPIDVLSHDTFESIKLNVLYVDKIEFKETIPSNYVTWKIREFRWLVGDFIVAKHLFRDIFCMYKKLKRQTFDLTFERGFFALGSFRVLALKPILLIFIIISAYLSMNEVFISIIFSSIIILIFPVIIQCKINNLHIIFLIIMNNIIQITPEPLIGSIDLIKIYFKILTNNIYWIPSIHVDELIKKNGVIYYSFYYYGLYSIAAIVTTIYIFNYNQIIIFFLANVGFLPFFSILTSLKCKLRFNYKFGKIRIKFRKQSKNIILKNIVINGIFGF